jgi:hypothetical protein
VLLAASNSLEFQWKETSIFLVLNLTCIVSILLGGFNAKSIDLVLLLVMGSIHLDDL